MAKWSGQPFVCLLLALLAGTHFRGTQQGRQVETLPGGMQNVSEEWRTAYRSTFGLPYQHRVVTSTGRWRVSLQRWGACSQAASGLCFYLSARRTADQRIFRFQVANLTRQIDAVTVLRGDRVAILGRAASNLGLVTLVALPSGRSLDTFVCFWPVVSPSRSYIAYAKWFPLHIGYGYSETFEYLVYDLSAPASANRPSGAQLQNVYDVGWPVYPLNARNTPGDTLLTGTDVPVHDLVSDGLFWIKGDTVALVDRWHEVNSLVVVGLAEGVRHPRVTVHRIETDRLVDFTKCEGKVAPSDLQRWRASPGELVHVGDIRRLTHKPGWVRLTLTPQACLATKSLDMPVRPGKR